MTDSTVQTQAQANSEGPKGERLEIFSCARLNPDAGTRVSLSHGAEYCGVAWARFFAHSPEESRKYPGTKNEVFDGVINFITANGTRSRATRAYLPGRLRYGVMGALDSGQAHVDAAFEIWVEYDPSDSSPRHYRYVVYDRAPPDREIDGIAVAAGIIPPLPPSRVLITRASAEDNMPEDRFDEETGELSEPIARVRTQSGMESVKEDAFGLKPVRGRQRAESALSELDARARARSEAAE